MVKINKTDDLDFTYIHRLDPELEEWRIFAAEWIKLQKRSQKGKKEGIDKFLINYIHGLGLPKFPSNFLSTGFQPPSFFDLLKPMVQKSRLNNVAVEFLDWILENHFSAENDHGVKLIAPGFANPFTKKKSGDRYTESNKTALPHRYLKELRDTLCPPGAKSFSDCKWAIENALDGNRGGDWFEVHPTLIDPDDPDCVWRERIASIYALRDPSKKSKSTHIVGERKVVEMWSPVRWVALYVKLELPLRTAQVLWLDSGEADTWRYQGGYWVENRSPLARGSAKHPYQKGIFRRSLDVNTGEDQTALYINTNKTADIDKAEDAKGYLVPWDHPRVLPWMERLRNWQAKYNPISAPVAWTSLGVKHLGNIKHPEILAEMGETCFLFRSAHARPLGDRSKPMQDDDAVYGWSKLLAELEKRVEERGDAQSGDGQGKKPKKLLFVTPNSKGTYFPLHSLRVSLITAYAIDGGVPLAILAKCIAGHARIIMTLYYTKAGIARVTEVMNEAERKITDLDKKSFEAFLSDATYKEIELTAAFNDPAAIQAILDNRSRAGWVVDEKGICPLGCSGCDKGYKIFRQGKSAEEIIPVPGWPQKNCVRCRFFLTGPAFLPGLQDHFNWVSSQLSDASARYIKVQQQVEELEDERMARTESGQPFTKQAEHEKCYRNYEFQAEKVNKLSDDLQATMRLVLRSIDISVKIRGAKDDGKLSLVTVGDEQDFKVALSHVTETHQNEVLCQNSDFHFETEASKPVLRRSQKLDACLMMNKMAPVFITLPLELQHTIGNQFMRLLTLKQGSMKGAVDVVDGCKNLKELGFLDEATNLIEHATGQSLLPNGTIHFDQSPENIGDNLWTNC